jgi:hypothetical protein
VNGISQKKMNHPKIEKSDSTGGGGGGGGVVLASLQVFLSREIPLTAE